MQRSSRDILRVGEEEHGNDNLQRITGGIQEAKELVVGRIVCHSETGCEVILHLGEVIL